MNKVSCLIVSSTIDYSTDLICRELERRSISYLRINRDLFSQYEISFDLSEQLLKLRINGRQYVFDQSQPTSIYYRAPVFNRYSKELSLEDQLKRSQWSSFMRNLIVFDQAKWINHPVSTYRAENKIYQLMQAKKAGLKIPHSYLGNCVPQNIAAQKRYIVKALDTPVFYDGEQEMFTYSIGLTGTELSDASLSAAPVIIQEMLAPKKDLRVTVVGNKLFPAAIQYNGEDIDGDWRKKSKDGLSYSPVELPVELQDKIHCLMRDLNLIFGGIDLAFCNGEYYFIEVNPTGEWGWLVNTAGFKIQKAIVDAMEGL